MGNPGLDQIVVARFRLWRSGDHVNLVYTIVRWPRKIGQVFKVYSPD